MSGLTVRETKAGSRPAGGYASNNAKVYNGPLKAHDRARGRRLTVRAPKPGRSVRAVRKVKDALALAPREIV